MDARDIAEALDGSQYPLEISADIKAKAKAAGLVIVYGASDDLMEFEGAIEEEIGCFGGDVAYLDSNGLLQNECSNDYCSYFDAKKKSAQTIEARWCAPGEPDWTYTTAIPHATFMVLEDGDPRCRGIVFALKDVR